MFQLESGLDSGLQIARGHEQADALRGGSLFSLREQLFAGWKDSVSFTVQHCPGGDVAGVQLPASALS